MEKQLLRESFVFYRSFYEAIRDLPRDVQGEIYTAIMEYGLNGKETEQLKPIARSVFTLMKPLLDLNFVRYENAKKGGAPRGNSNNPNGRRGKKQGNETNQEPTKNQPKTNQEPTKNQPYNVNVNVNDNVEREIELSNDNPTKRKADFDFSFIATEYLEMFREWLDYKKARKETYQTQIGVKKCYSHLLKLCNNNPETAKQIIDQSIANNWAGLFELKQSGKVSTHPSGESGSDGLKLGIGERIENGRRTYGRGYATIPMDAPPRPSEQYYWNGDNQQWAIA